MLTKQTTLMILQCWLTLKAYILKDQKLVDSCDINVNPKLFSQGLF